MEKNNLGILKKSFSLYYNGGEIWAEHLDAINNEHDLKQKFIQDMLQIDRPSTSSFVAVNLDETEVSEEVLEFILESFCSAKKQLQKVVFVGLNSDMKRYLKRQRSRLGFVVSCMDDYEKAKEWLLG